MYAFFSELLSDKKGGTTFSCFGVWHLCHFFVAISVVVIAIVYLKK